MTEIIYHSLKQTPMHFDWDLGGQSVFLIVIFKTDTSRFKQFRYRMERISKYTFHFEIDLRDLLCQFQPGLATLA